MSKIPTPDCCPALDLCSHRWAVAVLNGEYETRRGKRRTRCVECGDFIEPGQQMELIRGGRWAHARCVAIDIIDRAFPETHPVYRAVKALLERGAA